MTPSGFAPAKVNLFLHVGGLNPDGYHPLVSLMSFADVGDQVFLAPADAFGFALEGPFAADLASEDLASNLVWRAACKLLDRAHAPPPPLRLTLAKALPVAAGLGGGSSDAGAALALLRNALGLKVSDADLGSIAADLGSDGPACLAARPVLAQGRGERLSPPPKMPVLPAVLANPRVACPTGKVYRAFDEAGAPGGADLPRLPLRFDTVGDVVEALATCRNDLEAPAVSVAPEIATVLSALRTQPQALMARLSGSGATAFALCADRCVAQALARRIAAIQPHWWVRACRLGGPWSEAGDVHEAVNSET